MTHPAATQGLYDPAYEHDACGVALRRRRPRPAVPRGGPQGPRRAVPDGPPRRPRRRAEHRRRRRHDDPDPGRVLPRRRRLRAAAGRRVRDRAGVPADRRGATPRGRRRVLEKYALRRGRPGARLAGRAGRPDRPGRDRAGLRCRASARCSSRRRSDDGEPLRRPRPGARRMYCVRKQAERETRERGIAARLAVAVAAHHHVQGHADAGPGRDVLPGPGRRAGRQRSRWCTRGSRRTRSRRGRWPTRTGTSPTTARSTRSGATATGWPPARRCWPPT